MNTALEYSTRVVQEGGRLCKKSTLNDLVHLTPLRIPLMNPPYASISSFSNCHRLNKDHYALGNCRGVEFSKFRRRIYDCCTQRPCIFSWPMVISNSVNEFFVAV